MAIASIWSSMAACFTPTVLFITTNLIIATIFILASYTNKHHHQHHQSLTPISTVSSFLHRTTSLKLPSYPSTTTTTDESQSQTPTYGSSSRLAQSIHLSSDEKAGQLVRTPSFLERVKSFKMYFHQPNETAGSDTIDDTGTNKSEKKLTKKKAMVEMKKSHSERRMPANEGEDLDMRRPETARERRNNEVDEEVDARADDFISRFRRQLRLQRLESIARYNEMVNRRGVRRTDEQVIGE